MLVANAGSADTIKLGGTHSAGEIKATCAANGGIYTQSSTFYGCQGNAGIVGCSNDGQCRGACAKCKSVTGTGSNRGIVGGAGTAGNPRGTVQALPAASKVKPVFAGAAALGRHVR
jgi:hypothetical protein